MRSIDPQDTTYRPLAEYSGRLPSSRSGRKLNRATLWRWALHGTGDGTVLRTVRLGGCRFTCDAWVDEFIRARSAAPEPSTPHPATDGIEQQRILGRFGCNASVESRR